jgi:hypothetical protein
MRQTVDGLLVPHLAMEASLKEVDKMKLHPNHLKALASCGQGYLIQGQKCVGLNLETLDAHLELPKASPPKPKRQEEEGLRLHELFVREGDAVPLSGPPGKVAPGSAPRAGLLGRG